MIRVRAPSRLHFGPFALPAENGSAARWPDRGGQPTLPARAFGGVGLMIERPGVIVTAEPAATWSAVGPLAERALAYAQRVSAALAVQQPLRVVVEGTAAEHVGLGTGTQLGLAVADAVARTAGRQEPAASLARHVGRGRRSALGIHGFAHGGFLVEGGKRAPDDVAPLVARLAFPPDWRIVLVVPHELRGDHGPREAEAFQILAGAAPDLHRVEALCRLVLLGMLPALAERDLAAFGAALYDFNRRVGEMFRPWQGDLYAHPRITALVRLLRAEGIGGVAQSSWGPAVAAIVLPEQATELVARWTRQHGFAADELIVSAASNGGAIVDAVER